MIHPDEFALMNYLLGFAPEEEDFTISEHLASCDPCTNRAQAFIFLRENFQPLWKSWTCQEHTKAIHQLRLAEKLLTIHEGCPGPDIIEIFKLWLQSLAKGAEVVLKAFLDKNENLVTVVGEFLPCRYSFSRLELPPGVGSADEQDALQKDLQAADQLFLSGDVKGSKEKIQKIKSISATAVSSLEGSIQIKGEKAFRIFLDANTDSLSIAAVGGERPAMVMLVPKSEKDKPTVVKFKEDESGAWIANANELPEGYFQIIVSPSFTENKPLRTI
ncbi:MAG: hypothetical protein WA705_03255 [Candidatus Ozemobacteraceae bacterium]